MGAFTGSEIEFKNGTLSYKVDYVKKPIKAWPDTEKVTVRSTGLGLVSTSDRPGIPVATLRPLVAGTEPGPTTAKTAPTGLDALVGQFTGTNPTGHRIAVTMTRVQDKWGFLANYFDSRGAMVGTAIGYDFEPQGNALVFKIRYTMRPNPTYRDGSRRAEITGNVLTLQHYDNGRTSNATTYTRVK